MYTSSLNGAAIEYAKESLGETDEVVKHAVAEIHEFLQDHPKLNARNDHRTILHFLRSSKFNVEQAENKIKNYYKQRAERVEWFTYRDPYLAELAELLSIGVFLPLKQKDAENRQIVIIRTAAHDPSKGHKQNDVFKVGRMILDYLVATDELLSVYGIRAIFDMQGIAFGHALQMTPVLIKRAVNSWDSYPLRIQKLEFVNASFGINFVLDIFRSFMTAKMKQRVTVKRGNPDFVASDKLPIELGGTIDSYETLANHWKEVLEKNHKWFDEDDKYKAEL